MKRFAMRVALCGVALYACVPQGEISRIDDEPTMMDEPPDIVVTKPGAQVVSIFVSPSKLALEIDETAQLTATAMLDDDSEQDVTSQVLWTSSDDAVVTVSADGTVTGVAEGSVVITGAASDVSGEATVDVMPAPPVLESIDIEGPVDLGPGGTGQLVVNGTWSDGRVEDMTAEAIFASSDDTIIMVGPTGEMQATGTGTAQISATVDTHIAMLDVTVTCSFPSGGTTVRNNETIPAVSWANAYRTDGTQFSLSMEDVLCGSEFNDYSIIIFKIGAAWCQPCTQYMNNLAPRAEAIEEAGGLLVYNLVEKSNYSPADSAYAYNHVGNIIGNTPGIIVGDAETEPTSRLFYNAPITTQFPTVFVVRKRDMKVIVNQTWSNSMLPFEQIARNPEADWSDPDAPPFASNCGPNDEETYEPNNTFGEAPTIQPGTFDGGICEPAPDYYRIDIPGDWRLSLEFSHAIGDIDVYVWNESTNSALRQGGQEVGSDSATDDESFEHQGPALIRVQGWQNASAPYRLTLESL